MDCDIMQRCMKFRLGSYRNEWAACVINLYMTSLGTRFQTGWLSTWGKLCVCKTWSYINREVKSSNTGTVKICPIVDGSIPSTFISEKFTIKNEEHSVFYLYNQASIPFFHNLPLNLVPTMGLSLYRELLSVPIAASAPEGFLLTSALHEKATGKAQKGQEMTTSKRVKG